MNHETHLQILLSTTGSLPTITVPNQLKGIWAEVETTDPVAAEVLEVKEEERPRKPDW